MQYECGIAAVCEWFRRAKVLGAGSIRAKVRGGDSTRDPRAGDCPWARAGRAIGGLGELRRANLAGRLAVHVRSTAGGQYGSRGEPSDAEPRDARARGAGARTRSGTQREPDAGSQDAEPHRGARI
jgi:hypothetical protein